MLGGRAHAELTANMACMSVTLDVSRLSGWLKADVPSSPDRLEPT